MAHDDHSAHHVNYLYVFFALCGFTALSVVFDMLGAFSVPHSVIIVLVLAVACAKALSVMMFFMHLKFEGNWKYVLLAPTTILAIGLPLALYPDVGVAYYTSTAPQQEDWGKEIAEYKEQHDGEHGDAKHDSEPHEGGENHPAPEDGQESPKASE